METCMESYLVGEDFWDVNGNNTSPPADGPNNSSIYKKWKQVNAKAKFILNRTISFGLFHHIMKCKSANEIWSILDRLFNKKNKAQLKIFENQFANTTQEAISEARMKRIVIRGLKSEYISFVTSIQGWTQQPSLEEFENLFSSQELLAKKLARVCQGRRG
ncbi:hypothetical protein EJD97_022037 [Solanum chilense]|uniref:UBN2 domain-containing protein n=1 Tax=Solanum chilense TaxID=4083 RepID=A0A6N2AWH2_SOLCI|nr:hypothetical protein EJD97_022037 [Solanum chilense]